MKILFIGGPLDGQLREGCSVGCWRCWRRVAQSLATTDTLLRTNDRYRHLLPEVPATISQGLRTTLRVRRWSRDIDWEALNREHWRQHWLNRNRATDEAIYRMLTEPNG